MDEHTPEDIERTKHKINEFNEQLLREDAAMRAQLLKSNINITGIDPGEGIIYYDFAYRPFMGAQQRWGKTFINVDYNNVPMSRLVEIIKDDALRLRKVLEA